MRAISSMTSVRVKANSLGRMAEFMMACGETANSMGAESSSQRITWSASENGKMARKSDGSHEIPY